MKYPLRVVDRPNIPPGRYVVVDATHQVICIVCAQEWDRDFAEFIVSVANRWHGWRKFFRAKTRDDWLWERNTGVARVTLSDGQTVGGKVVDRPHRDCTCSLCLKWDAMWHKPFDWSGYDRSP